MEIHNKITYRILIPIYNDNISINLLINKIYKISLINNYFFDLLIVDDCSTENLNIVFEEKFKKNLSINILKLNQNLGHQKAIFIGLNYTLKYPVDRLIIMDSDGEDNPEYIAELIENNILKNKNIVAKRVKRKDNLLFLFFYQIYKFLFFSLTGYNLNFGNFSIIDISTLRKILNVENSYNHFAASLLKVDKTIIKLPVPKDIRYEGKSKMSFIKLIAHGLDAISIFRKEVIIRTILFSLLSEFILLITVMIIFYIRFFTDLLITGQTTIILFFLIIIGFVFIAICLLLSLSHTVSFGLNKNKKIYEEYAKNLKKII